MSDDKPVGELDFDKYHHVNLVTVGHFKKDLRPEQVDNVDELARKMATDDEDYDELRDMLGLEALRRQAEEDRHG